VSLKPFSRDVVIYTLQQAISSAFKFIDSFGRPSLLESKGDLYALAPIGVPNATMIERTTRPTLQHEVDLPEVPEVQEEAVELPDNIMDTKRNAFKWPGNAGTRFSESVRNGFIFDHEFTAVEKKAYLLTRPRLPFSDRLFDIANTEDLTGEDLTRFKQWNKDLIERFVRDKARLVGSVEENSGMFTLTPFEIKDGVPTRIVGSKSFKPTVCGTGQNPRPKVEAFGLFVDGFKYRFYRNRCVFSSHKFNKF
jgi:hypothetical protein